MTGFRQKKKGDCVMETAENVEIQPFFYFLIF